MVDCVTMLLHWNAAGRSFEATMTAAVERLMIQPRTILLIPHHAALPVTVPGPNSDPQDTCVVETGSNSQLTMIIVASCLRIRAWIGLPR